MHRREQHGWRGIREFAITSRGLAVGSVLEKFTVFCPECQPGAPSASSGSACSSDELSTYLATFAPNHLVVLGLVARESQYKFVRHVKIM
jgi:hypothetical protein